MVLWEIDFLVNFLILDTAGRTFSFWQLIIAGVSVEFEREGGGGGGGGGRG